MSQRFKTLRSQCAVSSNARSLISADIRNTQSIRWVMKNGRLYEAQTLTEVWPREQALPRLWFQ